KLFFELPLDAVPLQQGSEPEFQPLEPTPVKHGLRLPESNDLRDRARQPLPVCRFALQRPTARSCEGIELGTSAVFRNLPFGFDPPFLFELVECRVKGPIANLEDVSGHLFQSLADRPSVQGFKCDDLEKQKVQRALDEIGWFAHAD